MLVRRRAFEDSAASTPATPYFAIDACLRLHRAGWRVVFDPVAEVKHVVGGSPAGPYPGR